LRQSLTDILLNSSGTNRISGLLKEASNVERYQKIFTAALPEELQKHASFAALNDGLITAIAPNAAYATQIRMQQSDILQILRNHNEFFHAYQIRVKVIPDWTKSPKKTTPPVISVKNAELLFQEARLCDDEEIADVLASLASHAA
jgi:hypothetical protein